MANEINLTTNFRTKKLDKVYKKPQTSKVFKKKAKSKTYNEYRLEF